MTAVYIIRTVNEILDTLKYIESQIIVAENRLSKNQRNVVTIQRQVSEVINTQTVVPVYYFDYRYQVNLMQLKII